MICSTKRCRSRRSGGFTLVELLLVVSLVVLLTGALVFNFSNLMRGNQLEEGTTRLETLMRFARAQAANSGRKVQLVFSNESAATNTPVASTGEVRATWEPDPLGQPGCFSDLNDTQWHVQEINDLLQVESVKLLDTSAAKTPIEIQSDDSQVQPDEVPATKPMAPITFYPDGSSDSAEIIVAARDPEEDQRMAVRLVGLTGSISHQLLTADLDEPVEESGLLDRSNPMHRENVIRETGSERPGLFRLSSPQQNASGSRLAQDTPHATVGDTNTVDRAE